MISTLMLVVVGQTPVPTAVEAPNPETVTPGFLGFAFFVVLGIAAVVLYFSLRKQLKRIDFDEDATVIPEQDQAGEDMGSVEPGKSASG